jgi:hypothetical protein
MNHSTPTTPPKWGLARTDPLAFFGLAPGCDHKELRRQYNALIRQYKPERFPEEFQKIRAAYEAVDANLRYGQSMSPFAAAQFDWGADALAASSAMQAGSKTSLAPADPAPTLADRIRSQPLGDVYRDLQAKSAKTPFDYYALAVLSDIESGDRSLFFRWLLAGAKHFPGEPGLLALIHQFLRRELPAESLTGWLIATSRAVTTDRFYQLTEPAWLQLLRQASFGEFAAVLAKCEKNLKTHQILGRAVFMLRMLRSAIWKAPAAWTDQTLQFLEEHASEFPRGLESDLELATRLRAYAQIAPKLIARSPLVATIHDALVQFLTLPDREADAAVIDCQSALAADARSLLDAFGDADDEDALKLLEIWGWVNEEVYQRYELYTPISSPQVMSAVFRLLQDLDESTPVTKSLTLEYTLIRYGLYGLAAITPWVLFGPYLWTMLFIALRVLLSILGVLALHYFSNPSQLFVRRMERKMRRQYQSSWRRRFVQLFEAHPVTHSQMTFALHRVVEETNDRLSLIRWIVHFVPSDLGLAFFALAVRYRR